MKGVESGTIFSPHSIIFLIEGSAKDPNHDPTKESTDIHGRVDVVHLQAQNDHDGHASEQLARRSSTVALVYVRYPRKTNKHETKQTTDSTTRSEKHGDIEQSIRAIQYVRDVSHYDGSEEGC